MARIAGVDLPRNKRMEIALTYIFGIGRPLAKVILKEAGIEPSKKSDALDETEVAKIREILDRAHKVEGDLRRETSLNIKRLVDLGSYRGQRHRKSLPVRGQRTHSNARTRKGPAVAIAGKKSVKAVDLAGELDVSKSLVSDILHYRRGLSRDIIRKLANRFKVSQELFNKPYKLVSAINSHLKDASVMNTRKKLSKVF